MVIMMRPMMDHLHHTDYNVDNAQRNVDKLAMNFSEMRKDIEHTNSCLALLRRGLGLENEGQCVLRRGYESALQTAKSAEERMDGLAARMQSLEEGTKSSTEHVQRDLRNCRQEVGASIAGHALAIENLKGRIEQFHRDAVAAKEDLSNSGASLERELRDLRREQAGIWAKMGEKRQRAQQHVFASRQCAPGSGGGDGTSTPVASATSAKRGSRCGSGSQQCRVQAGQAQQPESTGQAASPPPGLATEDTSLQPRLPALATNGAARPLEAPRMRFHETMSSPFHDSR
eukprot:NODE_1343_length_1170_cov_536.858296.p1 GENE.NODE_1343_length_1170_cov_536.858296~~NODE_1343_length_1170_cov_536.858296.p1  ORF type:complete len:307 (-),score=80.93 NODE_1343_length_1170_cov_536.858296:233-1093(-)